MRCLSLCLLVLSFACGDDSFAFDAGTDSSAGADAGPATDAGADSGADQDAGSADGGPGGGADAATADAATGDAGVGDAGLLDAASPDAGSDAGPSDAGGDVGVDGGTDAAMDAGTDAGSDAGSCHAYRFGEPATEIRVVGSLPAMRGGDIPRGIYDAVDAQTTGAITGTYRGTWVFEDETTLQTIEQITLSGSPPAAVPRTQRYSAMGTNLARSRTCGGTEMFDNEYQVRMEEGRVLLDIRAGGLLFTFRAR